MDSFKLTQIVVTLVIRVRASRSLSFTPPFTAFFDAHFLLEKHGLHAHASIFFRFRIISVSLMLISLRPTPSLRRGHHLTTMPRGFYICITLSTSDIGWQPPFFSRSAPPGRHMAGRSPADCPGLLVVFPRPAFSTYICASEFILRASQAPTASHIGSYATATRSSGTHRAALPAIPSPPVFILRYDTE
jgi:hypothetical protein